MNIWIILSMLTLPVLLLASVLIAIPKRIAVKVRASRESRKPDVTAHGNEILLGRDSYTIR